MSKGQETNVEQGNNGHLSVKLPPTEGGNMTLSPNSNGLGSVTTSSPEEANSINPLTSPELAKSQAQDKPWWVKSSREWLEQYDGEGSRSAELWGPILLKGTLTLLVGESSAGKSVLVYRLAEALTAGKELLGLTPPKPLRVLHIDLETPDEVRQDLFEKMELADDWDIVTLDHIPSPAEVEELAGQYDVVLIDSLQVYDAPQDEDNNSEANRQMTTLISITRRSKAALLVTHNSGKGKEVEEKHSKFYARGASSRVDRADIVVNFYETPKDHGIKELRIVKSRHGHNQEVISFTFAGKEDMNYILRKGLDRSQSKKDVVMEKVCTLMADKKERSRQEIADTLQCSPEDSTFNRVLRGLVKAGKLQHTQKKGLYVAGKDLCVREESRAKMVTVPKHKEIKDNVKLPGSIGGKMTFPATPHATLKNPIWHVPQKAIKGPMRRPQWVKPAAVWQRAQRKAQ
jgi:DNA-binding transcriptional regulator YhcF (GntR family)